MKKFLFPAAFFVICTIGSSVRPSFTVTSGPVYSKKKAEIDRLERAELIRVETLYRYLTNLEEAETREDLYADYDIYSFQRLKNKLSRKETECRVAIKESENRDLNFLKIKSSANLRELYREKSAAELRDAEKTQMSSKREEEKESLKGLKSLVLYFNESDDPEMIKAMKDFNRANKGRPRPFRFLGDIVTKAF
ncbi:MAG: hypothetical protein NTU89_00540 [Candidatus Dependentiae bacterium]|nr:hypothetical protein [Candidatus Dependentiae bacterium]